MQPRFDGKTFMVTGAGTGFGAALSLRAAQEGAGKVIVHYRSSSDGAERTAKRVREIGAEALVVQGDITSWADIQRMAAWAFEEAGGVDVLINNVGDMASGQASWTEVTEEAIDHVLAVDIKGTMLMVHEFGQRMVARGGGAIVNVGSTVIVRGSPRAPQYAAGKYGLLGITKSYAKALAPFRLRWFEEPCDPLDFSLLAEIADAYNPPLATGENLFSTQDVENLVRFGGLRADRNDIIQVDPPQAYGIVQYARTVAVVERHGWPRSALFPHGGNQMSLAIAGGFGLGGAESYPGVFGAFGGFADDAKLERGYLPLSDRPGIGFEGQSVLYSIMRALAA